jgi:plastocyanin
LFDQYPGNNPDIYLHPGQTVSFNLNVSGHPFMIRVSPGGANYDTGLTHVSTAGIVTTEAGAQAKVTGTLIWKVPYSLVDTTYVYQCAVHSGMVGNLIIQNTVTGAIAAIANVAGESIAFAIALG